MLVRGVKIGRFIKNRGGFSLLETTLGLVMMGMLGMMLALFFRMGIESFGLTTARAESFNTAQIAMHRITQELMQINNGELLTISPTQIDFVDQNSLATNFRRQDAGDLFQVYRGSSLLANDLSEFSFQYFDASGAEITEFSDPSIVRRVLINFKVVSDNDHGSIELSRSVYFRDYYYTNYQ
ncbi:MAG: hypothetical protein KDK66_00825 [Deltaproteobacteria bacterium]|nr:hypothetical protein [Deltaproteobacteria bacterium]